MDPDDFDDDAANFTSTLLIRVVFEAFFMCL